MKKRAKRQKAKPKNLSRSNETSIGYRKNWIIKFIRFIQFKCSFLSTNAEITHDASELLLAGGYLFGPPSQVVFICTEGQLNNA